MSIGIEDIARRVGLSVSTVSKVLNGYTDVSKKTRELVLRVAEELEYHPSSAARNLRRQRTNKIGFLLPGPLPYATEYVGELLTGAALAAEQAGYNIVLYTSMADQQGQVRRICRAREVDGLLLRGTGDLEDTLSVLQRERVPAVVLGRRVDHPEISYVAPDNIGGGLMIMRHLVSLGHRRIAFTARPELYESHHDRMAGYRQGLHEAYLPYDEDLVVWTRIEPRSGYHAMNMLLELPQPPTALYAIHDFVAIDALQAAHDRGLRVPHDIAIVSFDGLPVTRFTSPPLTAVYQPIAQVGRVAVEALVARIADPTQPPIHHTIPVELIPRESTLGSVLPGVAP